MKCILPFMKRSILKFSSERDDLFARKMSFPVENRRSTEALDGIDVLYCTNKLIKKMEFLSSSLQNINPVWSFPTKMNRPSKTRVILPGIKLNGERGKLNFFTGTTVNGIGLYRLICFARFLFCDFIHRSIAYCGYYCEKWIHRKF